MIPAYAIDSRALSLHPRRIACLQPGAYLVDEDERTQTKLKQAKIARVLGSCRGGKTSIEIREALVFLSSINNFLAELQITGQIYKVVPEVEYFLWNGSQALLLRHYWDGVQSSSSCKFRRRTE